MKLHVNNTHLSLEHQEDIQSATLKVLLLSMNYLSCSHVISFLHNSSKHERLKYTNLLKESFFWSFSLPSDESLGHYRFQDP